MKLVDFLQGKWMGHPLHAAMVHVPVGLWLGAAILDLAVVAGVTNEAVPRLALYAALIGTVVALLAIPPGVADWSGIKREKPAWKLGLYHMVLNSAALLVWFANLGLRFGADAAITGPVWMTSCAGAVLVIASGYIGSRMVFDQGTSIARESKKKWRAIAEREGATLPEEK
ncbi:MAG: DUF2231 domain-containing protein [Opitutus sp.]|nr:DUF2231 domain-containing protein [Opitutus sp.]